MTSTSGLNRLIDRLLDEAINATSFSEKSRLIQQAVAAQLGGSLAADAEGNGRGDDVIRNLTSGDG